VWAKRKWPGLGILFFSFLAGFASRADANVTVLLEEPYSYDGALAGTGHTAVYLNRVCAASPVTLRRCNSGEHGVVISRYARIAGYDWIGIPLVPYLYAVDDPQDAPLYADPKTVAFVRDQYRRANLETIAPDSPGGETPKGDWYQLVGSSYDRTNFGFEIESSPEQDDALIAWLNSRPNRASYQFARRNCADFVREILDFYYPKSVSRASVADLFVSTPKHAAKSLVSYGKRHRDLEFTQFVIPQVPGSRKRSRPVRGVLESVFRAKKYMVVLAAFHPVIAGSVVSADLVGDRFSAGKNSLVFSMTGDPEAPPTNMQKRTYLERLRAAMRNAQESGLAPSATNWRMFVEKSQPGTAADGQLVLRANNGNEIVELGITRRGIQNENSPAEVQWNLMFSRMKQNLAPGRAPKISGSGWLQDWELFEKIDSAMHEALCKNLDFENQFERK
jgi:hypothetical protein